MKKINIFAAAAMVVLALFGCGNNSSATNSADITETTTQQQTTEVSTTVDSKDSVSSESKESTQRTDTQKQESQKAAEAVQKTTEAVQETKATQPKTTEAVRVVQGDPAAQAKLNMDYYQEVLSLVNKIRAEAGVSPLTLDTKMCYAATSRAMEMDNAKVLSHTRPNGAKYSTALDAYGITYGYSGENIASGMNSPEKVVEGWRNSPAHYSNMITKEFRKLGVGFSNANGKYWVQLFTD